MILENTWKKLLIYIDFIYCGIKNTHIDRFLGYVLYLSAVIYLLLGDMVFASKDVEKDAARHSPPEMATQTQFIANWKSLF